jgi:hypothetical protein
MLASELPPGDSPGLPAAVRMEGGSIETRANSNEALSRLSKEIISFR